MTRDWTMGCDRRTENRGQRQNGRLSSKSTPARGFAVLVSNGQVRRGHLNDHYHHPTSDAQGAITASMPAGSFVGALIVSQLTGRIARKSTATRTRSPRRLVSLQQWSITWGILIQYFIQFGCS
ncbi:hypothetical protein EV715DRAFT_268663, partial [Schizophyllum commune]